MEHVDCHKH